MLQSEKGAPMEKQYLTSNMVKVFSYNMPDLHSFYLSLNIKAGQIYEETVGITHLLEHMFFRRLDSFSQIELYRELDKYGFYFNGNSYKEFLRFEMTGNIKFFKEACKIFSKLLAPVSFTSADLKAEQKRICRELEEANYPITIDHLADKSVWKDTPLERSATPSSMRKISLTKLKEEREKIFTAENMFFYVTGDVPEENLRYLYSQIESFPVNSGSILRDNTVPPPANFCRRGPGICTKKSPYNCALFSFDYDALKYRPYEIDMLYDILFTGNSAVFNYSLSEQKALIYDYDARIEGYSNIGRIYFSYEIAFKDLYESLSSSTEVLRGIKTEITDFDFERVRLYYIDNANLRMDYADRMNWDMSYNNHILFYDYADLDQEKKLYEKVTKDRLKIIAEEIFQPANMTLAIHAEKKLDIALIKEIISRI